MKGLRDMASREFLDLVKIEDTFLAKLEDAIAAQLEKVLDNIAFLPTGWKLSCALFCPLGVASINRSSSAVGVFGILPFSFVFITECVSAAFRRLAILDCPFMPVKIPNRHGNLETNYRPICHSYPASCICAPFEKSTIPAFDVFDNRPRYVSFF